MILCAGEALIDMLPRMSTRDEPSFAPVSGGAVFNTAIALGRLGRQVKFFSGISTDLFGAKLMESLAASKVDATLCDRSDRPTTLAFVELTDGHAKYAFYDENTAGRLIAEADLPTPVSLDGVDALFFGGISLPVEPCGATYETLALREAANRLVMIDPNIRPGFIKDEARYRARLDRMIGVADIVKVSDEDLEWIAGDGDLAMLAGALLAKGPKIICVTKGKDGVTAYLKDRAVSVSSEMVEVVDTVGAGDTFNAGFLAGLDRAGKLTKAAVATLTDAEISAALTLGNRAAAVTVSRAGANPPWAEELDL
ncbi:carbohydrate kinase family protein [Aliiruegeria sabulilitoris]|uniref:carbohydrate kinase family protein n=1 Tax=Aliiruegeria sabulilitoris TaxID=1510458 RepID=UPI0008310839|nr:carbohydrate kinase [Aliiruegeria sabulilitoris]NDR58261.1 carbohydrate kinase [Pseudoruegeria sp. M32A2M]